MHIQIGIFQLLKDLSWRPWTLSPQYSPVWNSDLHILATSLSLTFNVWLLNSVKVQSLLLCPHPLLTLLSANNLLTKNLGDYMVYFIFVLLSRSTVLPCLQSMYENRGFLYFVWYSSCLQEDNSGPYYPLMLRSRSPQQTFNNVLLRYNLCHIKLIHCKYTVQWFFGKFIEFRSHCHTFWLA